jgi:hypothetical protein
MNEPFNRFHTRSLSNVKSRALFRSNRQKESGILGANFNYNSTLAKRIPTMGNRNAYDKYINGNAA